MPTVRWRLLVAVLIPVLAGCGGASRHVTTSGRSTQSAPTTTTSSPTRPVHSAAVILDATGSLVATLAGDGPVSAAVPDGRGGWYVAGSFTRLAGQPEHGIAHLLANATVDSNWHAALRSSGRTALAASPTIVYAAGSIGDTGRSTLLAFDATTGAVRSRLRAPTAGPVTALALAGNRLIVAGGGGSRPTCVAALDTATGRPAPDFSVTVPMQPELGCAGPIRVDGQRLYLAGYFQSVDGVRRPGLARIDARSGALDRAWQPPSPACRQPGQPRGPNGCDGITYDVAFAPEQVFVGGFRPGVVALSEATGVPQPGWHAPRGVGNVLQLATEGSRLFAGGDFTSSGRTALRGLAVLSAADGSLLPSWHPPAGMAPATSVASGAQVLVGLHSGR